MSGWIRVPEDWFATEEIERLPAELVVFHLSALAESCRYMTDGRVTARAIRRLWPVDDTDAVIQELVTAGLWQPIDGGGWHIRDWRTFLLSATEVEHRRAQSRETSERYRRHKQGDHSLCDRCSAKRGDKSGDTSRDLSVTSPEPIRSAPTRRGGEGAEGGGPSPAAAGSAATRAMPTHPWTGECCALPDIHPIHVSDAGWLGSVDHRELSTWKAVHPGASHVDPHPHFKHPNDDQCRCCGQEPHHHFHWTERTTP